MIQKTIFLASIFLSFNLLAQSNSTEGIIDEISTDLLRITHLTGKNHPNVGQVIKVDKRFQNGGFSGTHSLAEGTVSKSSAQEVQIKVSKYTSTLVENGVKRPMAKVNDHAIIKWEGAAQQLNSSSNDDKETISKLQETIYEAQDLIKERKYKEAVALLEPQTNKFHDCYACHYVLGQAYYELYEEEKAIHQMNIVIDAQGEKYSMAYVWRARAYVRNYPHQYEKAIEDYRTVLNKYAKDAETKSYILQEIIEIQDKMKDHDAACSTVKELQKIEGETADNKDLFNHYCTGIKVPEKKHIRFDGYVTEQSADKQSFSVNLSDSPEECYYSNYFDGEPVFQKATDLKVGTMVEISSCNKGSKMAIAVAKITAVKDGIAKIQILYWTNKINGHPWRQTFEKDKPLTFTW